MVMRADGAGRNWRCGWFFVGSLAFVARNGVAGVSCDPWTPVGLRVRVFHGSDLHGRALCRVSSYWLESGQPGRG